MKAHKGMVLLLVLILIIILSITVSSTVNSLLIDEKVIINQQEKLMALQAAESVLREAEQWLNAQVTQPLDNIWIRDAPLQTTDKIQQWCLVRDNTWWQQHGNPSQIIANHYYVLEQYERIADSALTGNPDDTEQRIVYRITAVAEAGSSRIVLQSLFVMRFRPPSILTSVPDLPLGRIAWQACY